MINNETFIYLQDVFWVIFHLDGSDTNYLILVTIKSDYVFISFMSRSFIMSSFHQHKFANYIFQVFKVLECL